MYCSMKTKSPLRPSASSQAFAAAMAWPRLMVPGGVQSDQVCPSPFECWYCGVVQGVGSANSAVTARVALIVSLHGPVPEQSPDHPTNLEPSFGVALSVTDVPTG